jgi:phosphoglycolate phosphatase
VTPRLLILDFDGTLADSWPWLHGAATDAARRFGFRQATKEEAEAFRGQDAATVMRALGVPAWKLPAIARHMRALAAESPPPLFPGIPAMLEGLAAQGVTLAIASSNAEATIRASLGPALAARIAHWGCGASLFGKAAKLRRILRDSGIPPGAAMAIGDETRDIEAAREAGIAAGAVAWGYAPPELLRARGADMLFDSPQAVLDWVAG